MTALNELLGYPADAKLLIISCDDLGSFQAANTAVYQALREGWATSAGLMVPAPWAREAASKYRGEDVGVHLTLTAEHELFRWGPITQAPSLLGGDGGFAQTVSDFWEHADTEEVLRECRAQIERAIYWGFDITHLDSHEGALVLRPEFFDIALELAIEFSVPLRLPTRDAERNAGFPFRRLAADENVLHPDHLVTLSPAWSAEILERAIADLEPGVTEFAFQPAHDTPELRAVTTDWPALVLQADLMEHKSGFPEIAKRAGATLIGYKQLRDAQRKLPRVAN
jgi:chitin disaccharide deacetylase